MTIEKQAREMADRLIAKVWAIVGKPDHPSLAGVTGYDEMVPSVYWPKAWLVEAFAAVLTERDREIGEALNQAKNAEDEAFNVRAQRDALVKVLEGIFA